MVLIYSMWQNIRILFLSTKIDQLSIISIKMNKFILLEIWILWMALGQHLLLTFLLSRSTFGHSCRRFALPKEIIEIVELIDRVIMNRDDEAVIENVRDEVNEMMNKYPLFSL